MSFKLKTVQNSEPSLPSKAPTSSQLLSAIVAAQTNQSFGLV
jgi:hypothetical protein